MRVCKLYFSFKVAWNLCNGTFFYYQIILGGRTADEIVNWLLKKTGPPAKDLTSVEDAKAFSESQDVVIVGCFTDLESAVAKEYREVASAMDEFPFGQTSDPAVLKEFGVEKDSVVLFKKVSFWFLIWFW